MSARNGAELVPRSKLGQTSYTRRLRRLVGAGLVATLAAMTAVALAAGLAKAVGVDFEIPEGGAPIPLPGFAIGLCCVD